MTAEERLAYFQGEKSRSTLYLNKKYEKNKDALLLKIKFFISVILFIIFLSLDYTGYTIKNIGSSEIIQQVTTDFDFAKISKIIL